MPNKKRTKGFTINITAYPKSKEYTDLLLLQNKALVKEREATILRLEAIEAHIDYNTKILESKNGIR